MVGMDLRLRLPVIPIPSLLVCDQSCECAPILFLNGGLFTGCGQQEEFKVRVNRVRTSHPYIRAHPFHHLSTGSRLILRAETRRETWVTMRRPGQALRSGGYDSIS